MHSINPLELPEIAQVIAGYLNDFRPCITVCKSWRSLYLPYYWREVEAGAEIPEATSKDYPPVFNPNRHGHYRKFIRELTVHNSLGSIDPSLDYPNLRRLRLSVKSDDQWSRLDDGNCILKDFVNRHSLLECLDVTNIPRSIMDSTWTALVDHPRLEKLIVRHSSSVPDDFWRVCARLRTLELSYSLHSHPWCIPRSVVLSSIRQLKIVATNDVNIMDELDIIAACPLLEELHWWRETSSYKGPIWARFGQLATQGTWPHLQRLAIYFDMEDADLSQVIASMHQATRIEIPSALFGPLSFAALQGHAGTLQVLRIPRAMDSKMTRDVLCTFPRLEHFEARRLDAKDIAEGGPWVCTSLKKLTMKIMFVSDEDHLQPMVFERISRLVHLEELDSSIYSSLRYRLLPMCGLIFRLQSGMGALAGLSRLRCIGMDSHIQTMDLDDARWMMGHWKRLETIRGRLSQDVSMREQVEVLFSTGGIKLQTEW